MPVSDSHFAVVDTIDPALERVVLETALINRAPSVGEDSDDPGHRHPSVLYYYLIKLIDTALAPTRC